MPKKQKTLSELVSEFEAISEPGECGCEYQHAPQCLTMKWKEKLAELKTATEKTEADAANAEKINPFSGPMRSALIFAARYTHNRNTGGTLAVTRALEICWHQLDENTRSQIIRESDEAEFNLDDWKRFRKFAEDFNKKPDKKP